jgi:hypothetical protein
MLASRRRSTPTTSSFPELLVQFDSFYLQAVHFVSPRSGSAAKEWLRHSPLRAVADNGAEFLDQADAASGSLGSIAGFKGEAGHGTAYSPMPACSVV